MNGVDGIERGDRIGDYQIVQRLRAGGMATLFVGRRHGAAGVSRPVVIKVIHPHLAEDDLLVRMFIDEARISSQISHPNVVYAETFGEYKGTYYLVLEYVDGCSAGQLLSLLSREGESLPPEIAVHIAIETAAGLHAAHETLGEDGTPLGIIHRDVSPSNILLTRDGGIKVIDFGIAKARNRIGITEGPSLKGKVRYMSPEQAWGKEIDRTTDVYALGIVLWELLTCRSRFKAADDLAALEQVRNPTVVAPSTYNPLVPPALDSVVMRAMAADPKDRQTSALELRRQLMHAVPSAVSPPEETISGLVARVRAVYGGVVISDPEEEKATTPATPSSPAAAADATAIIPSTGSSVRAAAGELVQTHHRSRTGWFALGGLAIAGGLVAAAITVRGGDDGERSARSLQEPALSPVSAAPPVDAPLSVPVIVDASIETIAGVDAGPAKPVPKRPRDPKATGARAVDVDGTVLADDADPGAKPTKKPGRKPPKEIGVDGTVLAE